MGEYATYNGGTVKIGTCSDMYYLRYEDRTKVTRESGNIDPVATDGLRFRLPFPDEDTVRIGEYEPFNRGIRLYRTVKHEDGRTSTEDWTDPSTAEDDGIIQLRHPSGLLMNVRCYHGLQLPEVGGGVRSVFWNGKTHAFELTAVKPEKGRLYGVVSCRFCRHAWRYPLEELLEWVPDKELRRRLAAYLKEGQS